MDDNVFIHNAACNHERCEGASPHQTRPFQRPGRSLKADWLDERPTSNGAVRERVEPARLGGMWFGADGPPSPPPSPRDLQCCLKVRQVRHRAPPRYTKFKMRLRADPYRSQITEFSNWKLRSEHSRSPSALTQTAHVSRPQPTAILQLHRVTTSTTPRCTSTIDARATVCTPNMAHRILSRETVCPNMQTCGTIAF